MAHQTTIRKATPEDAASIATLGREVVTDGTTYVFAPETTDDQLIAYWLSPLGHTYVA
jgi:hypothetical protein